MNLFNIVSGICSIFGLLLTIFATSKVIKIEKQISCNTTISKNKMKDGNVILGGNIIEK